MSAEDTVEPGRYDLPDGKTLHVTGSVDAGRWACVAYDHGPFCRRCQPIDGTLDALLHNVLDGLMEVRDHPDEGMVFRVTAAGEQRVKHMLERSDD